MLMLIVALLAACGLINPVNNAPPTPQFESYRYAVATLHSQRIADTEAHEVGARAEAARIQRDADAEHAALVAVIAAQRTIQQAQTIAPTAQPLRVAPQPVAPVAAPSGPGVYTGEALRAALAQTSWPRDLWPGVERRVPCESGGQTTAVSPGGHRGLMQVDPRLHGAVPSDAVGQLEQAWAVYQAQGWAAWSCY